MAKRELERIQARGGNKDQAQREWENKMREQNEARDALELYKNYKPDFEIKYHDEFGRAMTPKEAWKSLSHKFQYVFTALDLCFQSPILNSLRYCKEVS